MPGRTYSLFLSNSPERLAEAGEQLLRTLGLGFRAPYVANAARTVASGDLDLEALRYAPYQDAKERLMELPGIGPKIADCVLLHSLDKLEAFSDRRLGAEGAGRMVLPGTQTSARPGHVGMGTGVFWTLCRIRRALPVPREENGEITWAGRQVRPYRKARIIILCRNISRSCPTGSLSCPHR